MYLLLGIKRQAGPRASCPAQTQHVAGCFFTLGGANSTLKHRQALPAGSSGTKAKTCGGYCLTEMLIQAVGGSLAP